MSEILTAAKAKVEARARAKRDKFFLANDVLGFDFQWSTHAELFAQFPKFDDTKPWVEQTAVKDMLVLWSRGHYKTTAVIVCIIQAILNNPNIRILIMQGSIKVTKTLLHQIKSHFLGEAEGSRFKELFPEFCGDKAELGPSPTAQFTVPCRTRKQLAQATVTVASPKSIKTGQHYDLGVFDDLVNDQNCKSPTLLEKIQADFTLAQALIDPGCYRWVTGTRYAFGDLYEQILRWQAADGKWMVSVKDCWTDDGKNVRFPRFEKKNGEIGGFTREELEQMQRDDPANFACQYLNKPIHASRQAFTEVLLQSACVSAADAPPLSLPILVVDLAATDNLKSDDSVIMKGQVDSTNVAWLTDMRGGQWLPMELALNVIDMAIRHRPVKILFEKTASCIYFVDYLRLVARQKNIFLPVDFIKVDNQTDAKNIRVMSLAGVVKKSKFKFFMGLPNWKKFVEQACEFPKGRHGHDDYPDTAALLFQQLTHEMLAIPIKQVNKHTILAMMGQVDNDLAREMTAETELAWQQNTVDSIGLD